MSDLPPAVSPRVVRVLPDEPAIDKLFDYFVPAAMDALVRVGTMVRIELHGRRVGGWVVEDHVEPSVEADKLRPLAKVRGFGPPHHVVALTEWAAWRWAGRQAVLLRSASPERAIVGLARPARGLGSEASIGSDAPVATAPASPLLSPDDEVAALAATALRRPGVSVLRLPPALDPFAAIVEAARLGDALVIVPSLARAELIGRRLRRRGLPVAVLPDDWARAAAGGSVVVGARGAVWAPNEPCSIVVLDEHDEGLKEERQPTWHARDVAVERARQAGTSCLLISPCPTLEALALVSQPDAMSRVKERAGWAVLEIIDRTGEDPARAGLLSERLVTPLRSAGTAVCVLNRTGRSRLLACAACAALARCEICDAAVHQPEDRLVCARCGTERMLVCIACGGGRFKNVRAGTTRLRDDLEALTQRTVAEVTASTDELPEAPVYIGTEAILHRIARVDVVVFLDMDSELLAPRYRAHEQALALLARASRLVGGRGDGRVYVQTRLPDHEVLRAAALGDPARLVEPELARRRIHRFPPVSAMAAVSGPVGAEYVDGLRGIDGVDIGGTDPAMVRALDASALADALAAVIRPKGRLRVEVDPLRV